MGINLNTQGACCGAGAGLPLHYVALDRGAGAPLYGSGPVAINLRSSVGAYRDALLKLVEVGADTPRPHHDDTGTAVGWSVEGARSNFMLWSEDPSNAVWTVQGGANTIARVTNVADMRGDMGDVWKVGGGTGVQAGIRQVNGTFAATNHVAHAFVKYNDSSKCALAIWDNTGSAFIARVLVTFDGAGVITSAVLSGGSGTVGYSAWYGGWYRIWVNGLATAVGRAVQFYGRDPTTATTNTLSTYVKGIGLESTGSATDTGAPTSYIKTESTTVVRSADTLSIDATAMGLSFAGLTFAIKYWKTSNASATSSLGSISDGTVNNDVYLRVLASGALDWLVSSGGSDTSAGISTALAAVGFNTAVVSVAANDGFLAFNADPGLQDSTITVPTGSPTLIMLGTAASGVTALNGAITEFAVYGSALDDATVLSLAA